MVSAILEQTMPASCTRHRPRVRFHIRYEDFVMISDNDECNGDALRVYEMNTDWRIRELRQQHKIPSTHLPAEDDLWLDEFSLRDLEMFTLRTYCKSSYARCLHEATYEGEKQSLLELGFLRRRRIARPGEGSTIRPATEIYDNDKGRYILVDEQGYYFDISGKRHSAIEEGYSLVSWQYLYCIAKVEAAIAALDDEDPPEAVPRWQSMTCRGRQKKSVGSTEDDNLQCYDAETNISLLAPAVQGGSKKTEDNERIFENQNNTPSGSMSIKNDYSLHTVSTSINIGDFRSAVWNIETLLALSSATLAVPDRETIDDETWEAEWQKPAERLYAATITLAPMLAWERIDWTMRYMATPGSPSWWQSERARKTPITLRHVADNYLAQYSDLKRKQWRPAETTHYDGPPLFPDNIEYATGYGGLAPAAASEINDDLLTTKQVPAASSPPPVAQPLPGMERDEATVLADAMLAQYPTLSLGFASVDNGRVEVVVERDHGRWMYIRSWATWINAPPALLRLIELAAEFGASLPMLERDDGGGSQAMEEATQ